ncbi:MAG: flagellar biosynthesis protein FliQ [Lachnospiraceae bacterium]|jgi:flagellar biosynthetic protein FliQ|nr:flagellar biosynthesis protein FliQ [Lachnospiraceae bacterium]
MTIDAVMDITRDALFLIIKVSLPVLLVSLCVGLIVSIFQTVTSIQEQTLTFVPKIVCVFLSLVIFGNWMMNAMVEFMVSLWSNFGLYMHR